jgi:hypothetical protein
MNIVQSIIVVLCSTFSAHLFVISQAHELILVRFKLTFLFCINITNISNIAITISISFNISNIFYFLVNNNWLTIFNIVNIATAIMKFVHQFIVYDTQGITSIVFTI